MDADSVASSPRSDHFHVEPSPRVRFMCSFGGRILPRPRDNQLRYVGGDTRMVALHRSSSFSSLLLRLSKLSGTANITVKYQLPNEDLDSLISVTSDEDVENMIEEYDRVALNHNPRLRLFLFLNHHHHPSTTSSATRDAWFRDALNHNPNPLHRRPSDASSILSEVPDYLFAFDDTPEQQPPPTFKSRTLLNDAVPGSPPPVVPSPFCSTSSVPNLPPVKTKPDSNHVEAFQIGSSGGNNMPYYPPESAFPVPVYYIPGPVPVQPVAVQGDYARPYPGMVPAHQVPVGYHHVVPGGVYGGGMRAVPYEAAEVRVVPEGVRQQQAYQGVPMGAGGGPVLPAVKMVNGDELRRVGGEYGPGRGPNME